MPAGASREQAVRQAEITHLALALGQARHQLKDNHAQLVAIVEDIAPGKNKRVTLKLAPGRYVLICNQPGHYSMGLHTSLLVTP